MALRITAFSLLVLGGCALFVTAAVHDWSRVDWGDVPTWVAAITTLGAFLAAAWVVKIELRRDSGRRRELEAQQDAAERAEQADRVAGWTAWLDDAPAREDEVSLRPTAGWAIVLRNNSQLPIYDVRLILLIPQGGTDEQVVEVRQMSVVPPGTKEIPWPEEAEGTASAEHVRTAIMFRDAAGRTWQRNEFGVLGKLGTVEFPRRGTAHVSLPAGGS